MNALKEKLREQLRLHWWPPLWCLTSPPILGCVVGLIIGGTASWWINHVPPRWLEFQSLAATYSTGDLKIHLKGRYHVERECRREDGMGPIMWQKRAIATDGQVALYGVVRMPPPLVLGDHYYDDVIPLKQPINPDGWYILLAVICPGEDPEMIVPPRAVIQVIPPGLP